MIISASRRTDVPALYAQWFMNRVAAGQVLVPNPMNPRQISRVILSPETVDCMVFWTKNPGPLMPHLAELDRRGYDYYFQFTLTGYGREMEPGLLSVEKRIKLFKALSSQVGRDRTVWRYDPILFTPEWTVTAHQRRFERLAACLKHCTDTCVVSFLTLYRKCRAALDRLGVIEPATHQKRVLLDVLADTTSRHGMSLETCAQPREILPDRVTPTRCIDDRRISLIKHQPLKGTRDSGQRRDCRCVQSVDIGMYRTCTHGCVYCYAGAFPGGEGPRPAQAHDPEGEMLTGRPGPDDRITDRKSVALKRMNCHALPS